jgi:sec-independent protein translocase protein TatA
MADIGIPELLIILAIIMIVFGPSRLLGLSRALGESIRELRTGIRESDDPPALDADISAGSEQRDPVADTAPASQQ